MRDKSSKFDSQAVATEHAIEFEGPAVNFFEGALLGNGGLGIVVRTRPDAILVHFGHNSVWDQRIAEDNSDGIGTFDEVFETIRSLSEEHDQITETEWFKEYRSTTRENYRKPYPRPFPCGSLILGFDSRDVAVLGHEVDIGKGRCRVELLVEDEIQYIDFLVPPNRDRLWIRSVGKDELPTTPPFDRVRLLPDPGTPSEFPAPESLNELDCSSSSSSYCMGYKQRLPTAIDDSLDPRPGDKAISMTASFNVGLLTDERLIGHDKRKQMDHLERAIEKGDAFFGRVDLDQGSEKGLNWPDSGLLEKSPSNEGWEEAADQTEMHWETFWSRSGVRLGDSFLEAIWYRNLYFFNCAVKPGEWCPGLFANWSYKDIGTAWHGDYHGNYNIQQPFWVSFSSNHVEHHQAYVDMIEHVRSVARWKANEYYELDGACYPISSYPVDMNIDPYPVPNWGWSICVTPWMVQSLWWHYIYSGDQEFLADVAFTPIKEAVVFLTQYITRREVNDRFSDEYYHIFPSVPPELYGLQTNFQKNYDCLPDLTLTKFLFDAFVDACDILDRVEKEKDLLESVANIRENLPPYQTATTEEGPVWVTVPGEDPNIVYNVPANLMTIFPGEEYGMESSEKEKELAVNSYEYHRNEGGNDLVFLNLIAARLGELDLGRFKRHVKYSLLPNGTCANMVRQVDGRYVDTTEFDFMTGYSNGPDMGIWFENFSLPAVINECLLQGYTGTLRLFPNWPDSEDAAFKTLRAAGAFLVSAEKSDGQVQWVEITSEQGNSLEIVNPWLTSGARLVGDGEGRTEISEERIITLETSPGETIIMEPLGTETG